MAGSGTSGFSAENLDWETGLCFDQSDHIEGDSVPLRESHQREFFGHRKIEGGSSTKQYSYCDSQDSGLGSISKSTSSSSGILPSTTSSSASSCYGSSVLSTKSSGYKSSDTASNLFISGNKLSEQLSDLTISTSERTLTNEQKDGQKSELYKPSRVVNEQDITEVPERLSDGFHLTEEAFKINEDGDMSLHLAIIFQEVEVALILISLFPTKHLNHANELLQTALHLSVLTRQSRLTRALVLAGADLEILDRNGNTALHLACANNYLDCVGALTHRPTIKEVTDYLGETTQLILPQIPQSLEIKNYEGYTCIHIATFSANLQLLNYLVQLGANINAADNKSGRRPIHFAVEMNNTELVQVLVKRLGADVNSTTFDLNSPLHLAAGRDFSQLVYLLMDCGASRQAVNSEGLRPYQMAVSEKLRKLLQVIEFSDFTIAGM